MLTPIPSLHKLTNANNVVCHFVSAGGLGYESLTLFVDMHKKASHAEIASCQEGTIEGLPLTLYMKVLNYGVIQPDITLQKMKEFAGSHQLDPVTRWSIEDKMLRLDIDLSHFPELTGMAEEGKTVEVLNLPSAMISRQCRLSLRITSPGKAKWPLLQSPPNNSPDPVARKLRVDSSPHPAIDLDALEEIGTKRIRISDALTIDSSNPSDVKVLFYPKYNRGNVLSTSISLFNGITFRILIELMERDDPRIRRKKAAPATAKPLTNVKLKSSMDVSRKEKVLTLRFNANESHGVVDLGAVPELRGPPLASSVRAHHRVYRVAECTKAREDNFIVDFVAVRAAAELPTVRELYISIYNYLQPVKELASELNMEAVRAYLHMEYSYIQTAGLEEQRKFSFMVWGCVREYVIKRMLGLPHSMLKDESSLLSEMMSA